MHTIALRLRFYLVFWHKFELSASIPRDAFQNPQAGQFGRTQSVEGRVSQLARFDGGEVVGIHPDAFGKCFLDDTPSEMAPFW